MTENALSEGQVPTASFAQKLFHLMPPKNSATRQVRALRSPTNKSTGQIEMWTSQKTSSVMVKLKTTSSAQKLFFLTSSKNWTTKNCALEKNPSRKSTSRTEIRPIGKRVLWAGEMEDG